MTAPGITVYYKPGCPFAAKLRAKLVGFPVRTSRCDSQTIQPRRVRSGNMTTAMKFRGGQSRRHASTNPSLRQIRRARLVADAKLTLRAGRAVGQ